MLNFWLSLDHSTLFFINKALSNSIFDWFFPLITDLHKSPWFFLPTLAVVFLFVGFRYQRRGLMILFLLAVSVGTSDLLGGQILKPFFERPRPDLQGLEVVLRAPHANGYSFPSNHSMNLFAVAGFLFFAVAELRTLSLLTAGLVAFSRVYCGVHFPSDVLGGGLMGFVIGSGFAFFYIHVLAKRFLWLKS